MPKFNNHTLILDEVFTYVSNNPSPSLKDKILYSKLLEDAYKSIPAYMQDEMSEFKNTCLAKLDFLLTDGAKYIFNEEIIPVEYIAAKNQLFDNDIPLAISFLKKTDSRYNCQPAIDLLQKLATQSEITIRDKVITIDTESQELAKQALKELNINPITKDQNSPGQ